MTSDASASASPRVRRPLSGRAEASNPPPVPLRVRFDEFEVDEANARLLRGGRPLALAPTPFAVLCALVREPGTLITNDALLDAVWGHRFVSKSVLKTAIGKVRTAFTDDARQPRYIETVSRRGYRFIACATPVHGTQSLQVSGVSTAAVRAEQAPPITGRVEALDQLRAAWQRTTAGTRSVVWIAGDPGIGKTTLIDYFGAALDDVAIARGQCVEQYGAAEPYLPILEALAELSRTDDSVVTLLRTVAPTWLLQLPWLSTPEERSALRRELAGVRQERMLREMGEFLDRYTEKQPLLLVTEDLHWSDHATTQLMDHIARRRGKGRVMWLASFRLAEIIAHEHPLNALRNELRLHGLCEEIVLDPFSEQEVADYIEQHAPSFMTTETFVRELHERTDGLPLMISHVVSDLRARSTACDATAVAPHALAKVAIPEDLAAIIAQYVARLAKEQLVVLEAGAVCGTEFHVNAVASVLERDPAEIVAICDELARSYLWLKPRPAAETSDAANPSYSFRHALFREVLYDRIGLLLRARLHCRAGAALERERREGGSVTAAELAMHFELGRDVQSALRHYAEAAQAALLHFSPTEARRLTEHGLALLEHAERTPARDALEITLATLQGMAAAHLLGLTSFEAKSALQRAHSRLMDVPQHPMRALLTHELGFVLCLRGDYAEALALAEHTESLSRAAQDPALLLGACIVRGEVHLVRGCPRLSLEWAQRGIAASECLDDSKLAVDFVIDPRVTLQGLHAVQLLHLGLVQQARACIQENRARVLRLAQPIAKGVSIWFEALVEVRLGNAERVACLAREMQAIVDEFEFAQGRAASRFFRGWAEARLADPLVGFHLVREAYEENVRLGMRAGASEVLGYAVEALVRAREWRAAQEQLEQALQIVSSSGERVFLSQLFLLEAAIADGRGDAAAACASRRRALAVAREQHAPWLELQALLAICERDGAAAQERRELAALIDELPEAVDTTALTKAHALLEASQ